MTCDNTVTDRKTKPCTFAGLLSRKERLEYLFNIFIRYARAGVGKFYLNMFFILSLEL